MDVPFACAYPVQECPRCISGDVVTGHLDSLISIVADGFGGSIVPHDRRRMRMHGSGHARTETQHGISLAGDERVDQVAWATNAPSDISALFAENTEHDEFP